MWLYAPLSPRPVEDQTRMSAVKWCVQSVITTEELWALAPQWHALELASGTNLPFQTWEWTTSWWKYLREDGAAVRDLLRVYVIRRPSGDVIGIVPFMLTERPSFGPVRLRILQFIGADPNITELRSVLCRPEHGQECYAAIQAHLASTSREWDWIEWDTCEAGSFNLGGSPLLDVQSKSAYVLELAPTWPQLKQGLRRNIKESLRKCYNSLKRDGLTYRLDVLEEPADIARVLPQFFRLHTARANLKGAPRHADVFTSRQSQAFVTDVCLRLAERGVAKVFELSVDGNVVATRVGFEMANALYLFYSGWDPSYRKYSVMTTLLSEVVQYAIARGLSSIHLSTGMDVSKTRWGAHEMQYTGGVQLSARLSARAAYVAYRAGNHFGISAAARAIVPFRLVRRSKAR
jgi:CelD/BcsL family acetyltransferase involved in cellulose biosynthesis